jgi:hypothetical protein
MRESLRARLARFTVKSCLRPALQPSFPARVQRHWANIATRTLSVPFGVRFSQAASSLERISLPYSSLERDFCLGLSSPSPLLLSHLPPGTGFLPPETDAPKEPQKRRPPAETEKPLEEIARNGRKSALLARGL